MGKNHRHSKKVKSEKNKVHIKSKTKFLPKGQNVTNTAFKIRPIVIPEQLRERQESILTNRKNANIDELATKLKHFNDTIKAESCQDLKDLIAANPLESVQIYLSAILKNGSALVQDRERKVRRAAVKLLHGVFEKMSLSMLRPFFGYILTNLKCAMTHINRHIQEDSLLLLDAILEHQSRLVAENFGEFFPNFLLLISKSKSNTNERSLSLNLDGKITSVKWRVKVLTRLYGILKALIANQEKKSEENVGITVDAEGKIFFPIYRDISIYETNDHVLFSKKATIDTSFESHLVTLTLLLYDIWLEIIPEKTSKVAEGTTFATDESVSIFICIANIVKLLQQLGNETIFVDSRSVSFLDSLMCNFPFSNNRKNLQMDKDFLCFGSNHDSKFVEENLTIIYIFLILRVKNARNAPRHKSLLSFIKNCLSAKFRLNPPSLSLLVKILKEILLDDRHLSRKLGINEADLMEDISGFYSSGRVPEKMKFEILEILTSSRLQKQHWMEQLPDLLCENRISGKLIDAILDACQKGEAVVQTAVRRSLRRILENLPKLEIIGTENVDRAWRNLASIFFYVSDLNNEDLEEIRKFSSSFADLSISRYLKNVVDLKSDMR